MNKAIIRGHLGQDPETRSTQSGQAVANFSVATTERWKDGKGEKQEETTWHNIVAWAGLADVAKSYLRKGSSVLISGRLQTRKYADKQGVDRYVTEIVAQEIELLDRKDSGERPPHSAESQEPTRSGMRNSSPPKQAQAGGPADKLDDMDDDLPF